jgi:hypothetical protein
MAEIAEWYEFADRIYATAISMFSVLELPLSEEKQYALTLLSRTISNFEGAVVLHKLGRIVEARILMRCCYENLFYIAGISKRGDKFIKAMKDDHAASRLARGQLLFQSKLLDGDSEAGKELKAFLKGLEKGGRSLQPKGVSSMGALELGYVIYAQVSEDAAHPTVTSLSRHIVEGPGGSQFSIIPTIEDDEPEDTINFTCGALLGACFATGEVLGGSRAAPDVKLRLEEIEVLQGLKK